MFHLLALIVLGLMCGSEFNVGAFAHPAFDRQPLDVHIPMRSALAALFGRVMPFWMAGSTLLNLLILLPFMHLSPLAWQMAATGAGIQVFCIVFSLIGAVPINNRITTWTAAKLPTDWKAQEHLWAIYHWVRTFALIVAFALLTLSFKWA
jgi:uncharacterized membrane protein